jgi:hypothetical protein
MPGWLSEPAGGRRQCAGAGALERGLVPCSILHRILKNVCHDDLEALDLIDNELGEAVKLHGDGGSLRTRLFLVLAHQRLGHGEEAEAWQKKAQRLCRKLVLRQGMA